jgi:hypothetical protein
LIVLYEISIFISKNVIKNDPDLLLLED